MIPQLEQWKYVLEELDETSSGVVDYKQIDEACKQAKHLRLLSLVYLKLLSAALRGRDVDHLLKKLNLPRTGSLQLSTLFPNDADLVKLLDSPELA